MLEEIRNFLKLETAGGVILLMAAVMAMIIANSPLHQYYDLLIEMPVEVRVGPLFIGKPLLLWINDGLMAIFFLLVGLELKREILEGELSSLSAVALPAFGAVGGMLVPAAIYVFFNWNDPVAIQGWAIPAATDIAFALGIMMLLGKRVPVSLKVFLTSLAIFDDIGAVVIIALFYTTNLSTAALTVASICIVVLFIMNRRWVSGVTPYIFVGAIMWVAVLKSGVHATLAGVILALFIPMRSKENPQHSPLCELEHDLHRVVAFAILPLFAFFNAGISILGVSVEQFFHPVPVGISAGLFIGKQLGIFAFCWVAVKLSFAKLPDGSGWLGLYGVSILCGIGFTMSLFIGSLAFEETGVNMLFDERLGIIVGSLLSGIAGYLVLRMAFKKGSEQQPVSNN